MWALTKVCTGLKASCCSFSRARTRATTLSTSCTNTTAFAKQNAALPQTATDYAYCQGGNGVVADVEYRMT